MEQDLKPPGPKENPFMPPPISGAAVGKEESKAGSSEGTKPLLSFKDSTETPTPN